MAQLSRRKLLAHSGASALGVAGTFTQRANATEEGKGPKLRVVVAGGHPGDPEAGCGGTMARLAQMGHEVTALYLTRGEAGVSGKTAAQASTIRSAEAAKACEILKVNPVFASQIDAATEVNPARSAEFTRLIANLHPDVVFTQWPVDTHADHRACASLTLAAWVGVGWKFALYFYEVDLGSDTQCFRPSHYVDVTEVESLKRDACMAHTSQNPQGFYLGDHVPMMRFRGMECGRKMAEAFIHHDSSPAVGVPGLL
jgi:LmbE family N-acetylglucosaminyl deacetylase